MSWKNWCSSLILCVLAGHVQALPLAQYDFTDFQIALVDLDPDDGIDPSVEWGIKQTSLHVYEGTSDTHDDSETNDWGEHAVSINAGSATSSATEFHGEVNGPGYRSVSSNRYADFALSAHTQLVLTGLITMSVEGHWTDGQVGGAIEMYGFSPDQYSLDRGSLDLAGNVRTSQKRLMSTFKNEGDVPIYGSLGMGASAYSDGTPVVPEPQVWLMAACGLGLVGMVAGGRRTAVKNS